MPTGVIAVSSYEGAATAASRSAITLRSSTLGGQVKVVAVVSYAKNIPSLHEYVWGDCG